MAVWILALVLLIPVVEILVIIGVGSVIGAWPTAILLVAISLAGAWLVRREGRRAWRALRESLNTGQLPDKELADTPYLMAGGLLLLIPGFVTDIAALLLLLPFTRPFARRLGHGYLERRARQRGDIPAGVRVYPGAVIDDEDEPPTPPSEGPVIRGEVLGPDR